MNTEVINIQKLMQFKEYFRDEINEEYFSPSNLMLMCLSEKLQANQYKLEMI